MKVAEFYVSLTVTKLYIMNAKMEDGSPSQKCNEERIFNGVANGESDDHGDHGVIIASRG